MHEIIIILAHTLFILGARPAFNGRYKCNEY